MKATGFESRHQTLLHLLVVGAAVLTYLVNPDDSVWAVVRDHANNRLLERVAFGIGTILFIGSASLETWGAAYSARLLLSRLLFALALALLLPLPGALILIVGETVLAARLCFLHQPAVGGFRRAVSKWGLVASMIVFTITLKDSIAETGAGISFLIWLVVNRKYLRT